MLHNGQHCKCKYHCKNNHHCKTNNYCIPNNYCKSNSSNTVIMQISSVPCSQCHNNIPGLGVDAAPKMLPVVPPKPKPGELAGFCCCPNPVKALPNVLLPAAAVAPGVVVVLPKPEVPNGLLLRPKDGVLVGWLLPKMPPAAGVLLLKPKGDEAAAAVQEGTLISKQQ